VSHTRPLRLRDAAFLLDRLSADCAPLQEYRELTQNSIDAILRTGKPGEIRWDVDWALAETQGIYKLCIVDTGDGMTHEELVDYINQLSSSSSEQSLEGHYGVGAKITAGVHNPEGLVYMSWKQAEPSGSMIHFWRDNDAGAYGLKQFELADGSHAHVAPIEDDLMPSVIKDHGTKVVLLGDDELQNTALPPEKAPYPTHWLVRYLNRRYFRFPEGITVKVREFAKRDPREWPVHETGTIGHGAQLREVLGQRHFLERYRQANGTVPLEGANAHWWLLPSEMPRQIDIWQTNGHIAALHDDELYELREGQPGRRMLQLFGVLFGTSRVVVYVEPTNGTRTVTTNTPRNELKVDGEPLPWDDWADEFRQKMPEPIQSMMDEIAAGSGARDHHDAIRQRLKSILELFKLTRYRRTTPGPVETDGEAPGGATRIERPRKRSHDRGGGAGGAGGDLYGAFIKAGGDQATPITPRTPEPKVDWVFLARGTREPDDLEDRAARYLPREHRILANGDFRVYTDMTQYFVNLYVGIPGAAEVIAESVREWFEQQLIETVMGVRALEGSRLWSDEEIENAWSEEALSAAVMPRYHVYTAIKRHLGVTLGSLKEKELLTS
jgi:hypothetical protein